MSLDAATRERIETLLKDHRVVLFMKGNRPADVRLLGRGHQHAQ